MEEKDINSFYKHPKTKDGLMEKCKNCHKLLIRNNYLKNIDDPNYIEKERKRGREKYKRLGSVNKNKIVYGNNNAARFLRNKGFNLDGLEVHHWNYNKEKCVFILSKRAHKLIHKYLELNIDMKIFTYNNKLLDSKIKHHEFIIEIFKQNKVNYEIGLYPLKL